MSDPRALRELSLRDLLIGASEAPRNQRMQFRDPIAAFGKDAISAIEAWMIDTEMAALAVRTIGRIAATERVAAIAALKAGLTAKISDLTRSDITAELTALGVSAQRSRPTAQGSAGARPAPAGHPDELVVDQIYKRAELHQRLGGNPRSGISHPAGTTFLLLFSKPAAREQHGYNDRWDGADAFLYFGGWSGGGDMTLTGANREIIELSPHLHLLTEAAVGGYQYRGRFRYDRHSFERAERDGGPANALVFRLVREKT